MCDGACGAGGANWLGGDGLRTMERVWSTAASVGGAM